MKIVIEIPEKTNAHIRSDYGHGMKCLFDEDVEILCDAIYHGTPYKDRPHGEWISSDAKRDKCSVCDFKIGKYVGVFYRFCPNCGAPMTEEAFRKYNGLKEGEAE